MGCFKNNIAVISMAGAGKNHFANTLLTKKLGNRKVNILYLYAYKGDSLKVKNSATVKELCYLDFTEIAFLKDYVYGMDIDLIVIDELTIFLDKLNTEIREVIEFSYFFNASLLLISQYDFAVIEKLNCKFNLFVGRIYANELKFLYMKLSIISKVKTILLQRKFGKMDFMFTKVKIK